MIEAHIYRGSQNDQGTIGVFVMPALGFSSYVMELPYKWNIKRRSSVKPDTYICKVYKSPKYGIVFKLTDKHRRSYILMHPGNVAGDVAKGYKTHSLGCILMGSSYGKLWKQKAVFNSRSTVNKFMRLMDSNNVKQFKLTIQ